MDYEWAINSGQEPDGPVVASPDNVARQEATVKQEVFR